MDLIWATWKAIYFWLEDWTGSIGLMGFGKFAVWRKASGHAGGLLGSARGPEATLSRQRAKLVVLPQEQFSGMPWIPKDEV
jgi:hypothetical protein